MTPKALAPGSYHQPDRKTPGGQSPAPEPEGQVWLANGIYPGWQTGARLSLDDPREPAPSLEEVGRGPLPEEMGRFKAVRLVRGGAVLEYTAGGADVREWMTRLGTRRARRLSCGISTSGRRHEPLWLVLGFKANDTEISLSGWPGARSSSNACPARTSTGTPHRPIQCGWCGCRRTTSLIEFCAAFTNGGDGPGHRGARDSRRIARAAAGRRKSPARVTRSTAKDAYVVDDIALPLDNPWRRNVRLGDIQFLKDGTGVGVTLDGDVWFVRGLARSRRSRCAGGASPPACTSR